MILISRPVHFTLEKAAPNLGRERFVQSSLILDMFEITDVERVIPFRALAASRMKINKAWPVFVGAEGLRPYGSIVATNSSMVIRVKPFNTIILIDDWERGAENLGIFIEAVDQNKPFHDIQLGTFGFQYDGLNMQDIYDGTTASAFMCLDVEAIPYNV